MFVFGNILSATVEIVDTLLHLYMWTFIISAVLSWVRPDPYSPIVRFLYQITEPALRPIRRLIPMQGVGLDFSPVIVIFIIIFIRTAFIRSLAEIAMRMR